MNEHCRQQQVHGTNWWFQPFSLPPCCVLCLLEDIQNRDVPGKKRRKLLSELTSSLTSGSKLVRAVASEQQILSILVETLTGLLGEEDALQSLAVEALVRLGRHISDKDLDQEIVKKCIGKVVHKQNVSSYRGQISLIGQLICASTTLSCYITAIYKDQQTVGHIPMRLSGSLCQYICLSICSSQLYELQLNLLALIQVLMETPEFLSLLLDSPQTASSAGLLRGFRRILTSDDDTLRIATVQCCLKLLNADSHFAETLLECDISEFLCELLTAKNEVLLGSALKCLHLLADCYLFYSNCHSIYGIEAIVSANAARLKNRTPKVTCCGLQLLERILSRQPNHLPLFNSVALSNDCMVTIASFLSSKDETVEILAWRAIAAFLRPQHIPQLVNMYGDILSTLAECKRHCPDLREGRVGSKNQDLLGAVVIAMERACHLGTQSVSLWVSQTAEVVNPFCTDDASQVQSTDQGLPLQQRFCHELAELCDTSCIPWAMILMKEAGGHQALQEAFYRLLTKLITFEGKIGDVLAVKWADVGLLALAVEAKMKSGVVGRNRGLSNAITEYLSEMCYRLVGQWRPENAEEAENVRSVLRDSLPTMTGTVSDSLSLLYHRFSPGCASARHQTALLVLLTLSAIHNHRLVAGGPLLSAMASFIELVGDVCLLPSAVLKFSTFLFADCVAGLTESDRNISYQNAEGLLCRGLQLLPQTDVDRVIILHPTLLKWMLSSSLHGTSCARGTLQLFLTSFEDVEDSLDALDIDNESCISCLTNTTILEDTVDVTRTVQLLNTLHRRFTSNMSTCSCTAKRDTLVRSIYSKVTKLLSSDRLSPLPDASVHAALSVLTRQSMLQMDFGVGNATELKYVCQVISILERSVSAADAVNCSATSSPCFMPRSLPYIGPVQVILASLNYLHVVISLASAKGNHQVPSVLLSTGTFTQCLQRLLRITKADAETDYLAGALYVTGLLVESENSLSLTSVSPIQLSAKLLLKLTDPRIQTTTIAAAMFLWSALFRVSFQAFIQLTDDHGPGPSTDTDKSNLPINGNVLRCLVIHVQSNLLQGDSCTATLAVKCLGELLAYTDSHSASCAKKLAQQPWNLFCVKSRLLFGQHTNPVSTTVLVSLLIKYSGVQTKHQPWPYDDAVASITDWFINLPSLESIDSQLPWAFVQLMKQVIEKDLIGHVTDEKCQLVTELMQHMRNSLSIGPDEQACAQPKFLDINGVLVDHRICLNTSSSAICLHPDNSVLQTVIEGLLHEAAAHSE